MGSSSSSGKIQIDRTALALAVHMVGQSDFYSAMLTLVGAEVSHDLLALARYSQHSPPDLVAPHDFNQAAKQRYCDGLYRMDPFFRVWGDRAAPGVVTLKDVAPVGMWHSSYATEFLRHVQIQDEVCVFLPPLRGSSVALIIDRAAGDFSLVEKQRVNAIYPVLVALHELHIKTLFATEPNIPLSGRPGGQPLRVLDSGGHEVFSTPTWSAQNPSGQSRRLRLPLGPDFVLAPGGTIEYIDIATSNETCESAEEGFDQLTAREHEIVGLTLQGYPTISIARRLGIAVGTVKNHRTRIFKKLDITTERELLLFHMNSSVGQPTRRLS